MGFFELFGSLVFVFLRFHFFAFSVPEFPVFKLPVFQFFFFFFFSFLFCDDLDWLFQKLNEKLELVQKVRLGPGYDSGATVLNRCVTYRDSGLTWEADPRHAELAVAELGLQAARP